jgi:hypothetical protein
MAMAVSSHDGRATWWGAFGAVPACGVGVMAAHGVRDAVASSAGLFRAGGWPVEPVGGWSCFGWWADVRGPDLARARWRGGAPSWPGALWSFWMGDVRILVPGA